MIRRNRTLQTNIKNLRATHLDDIFGDVIEAKQQKVLIGLVNSGGIPIRGRKEKDNRLREIIKSYGFEVFGITETNVNWSNTRTYDSIWERTFGWFRDLRIAASWNKDFKYKQSFQRGGTLMMSTGKMAGRTKECRSDPSRLGRWSEMLIQGKEGKTTRIVMLYRPNLNGRKMNSAYNVTKTTMTYEDDVRCPREAIYEDLDKYVEKWTERGESIIIMLDANEDVRTGDTAKWMKKWKLKEAIMSLHGNNAPPTYTGGSSGGQDPIDGIFVSEDIIVEAAGYLAAGQLGFGDHRCLWIQIDMKK